MWATPQDDVTLGEDSPTTETDLKEVTAVERQLTATNWWGIRPFPQGRIMSKDSSIPHVLPPPHHPHTFFLQLAVPRSQDDRLVLRISSREAKGLFLSAS